MQGDETAEAAGGEPGWSGSADWNLASNWGNSSSGSIGLAGESRREIGRFRLLIRGGLLRASTDTVKREAFGAADSFEVSRTVESKVSADRAHLRTRISQAQTDRPVQFFATAGWERDARAGVKARLDLGAGIGASFGETPVEGELELGAGMSYTHQSDEVVDPDLSSGTLGLRFDMRAERSFRGADLALIAASTWSLGSRDDLRLDVTGSAAFPLSRRLAFRTSLQTLFDTRPSLDRVRLRAFPGGPALGTVIVPRQRFDRILMIALALQF